jgi:hypothetical protein
LLVLAPAASAAGLYAGQVPVNSQSEAERAEALKSALAQVISRLAGDPAELARPDVARGIAGAARYVQQYQYVQDVSTESGRPEARLSLVAQFDRDAVDQLLRDSGLLRGANASEAAAEAKPQSYRVWVAGVQSADAYARLIGSLSHNELVRGVQALQARGDGVELRLDVTGSLQRLLDSFATGPLHVVNAKPPVDGVDALLDMQR